MRINELADLETSRLPLFLPFILGIGILFGVFFPYTNWHNLFIFLFSFLILFIFIYKKSKIIGCFVFIFAVGVYVSQTGSILSTNLLTHKKFVEKEYENVTFFADVGYIDENHPTMKNMRRISFKNIKFVENNELSFIDTAKMTCSLKALTDILPNDRVKVKGKISPYKICAIPGSFDQRQYNSLVKIDATGIAFYIKKLNDQSNSFDFFNYARRFLTRSIIDSMINSKASAGIAASLLTGDKSSIPINIRDSFVNTGIAHILAISGLHMSIVASILYFILFRLFLLLNNALGHINFRYINFRYINSKKYASIFTIILTFLYLGLSGFSPSATRAFIMTTMCLISIIFGRGTLSLRSISFAAFLILLFDSGSLFLVSFQLSFCAVTALISFYETYKLKILDIKSKSKNIIQKIIFYFIGSTMTTIVATISTFPITSFTFNRLSISGILGNFIAIPFVSFIIIPLGILTLIFGRLFNKLIYILEKIIGIFIDIINKIASIPGSVITIKSPGLFNLYFIIIGGIILCLLKTKLRHIGSFIIFISSLFWVFNKAPDIIVVQGTKEICFIENDKFFTTSLQKGRNKIKSIQRNLGFSGKLEKRKIENLPFILKVYDRGLFYWSKDKLFKEISQSMHPYCPAYYSKIRFLE